MDEHMLLSEAWEKEAHRWVEWARTPGHDSYWKFHKEQFLPLLPSFLRLPAFHAYILCSKCIHSNVGIIESGSMCDKQLSYSHGNGDHPLAHLFVLRQSSLRYLLNESLACHRQF